MTDHHARDPAALRISLLPQVDIVQLHPHDVLFGCLEMFALFRVGLDLCDPGLFDFRVGRTEKLGERGSEGEAGVMGEGEVDVVTGKREELECRRGEIALGVERRGVVERRGREERLVSSSSFILPPPSSAYVFYDAEIDAPCPGPIRQRSYTPPADSRALSVGRGP